MMCPSDLQIQEANFDIMTHEERTMTEAEVRILYQHRAGEVGPLPPPPHNFSLHFFLPLTSPSLTDLQTDPREKKIECVVCQRPWIQYHHSY